jgi:hypothetical protein
MLAADFAAVRERMKDPEYRAGVTRMREAIERGAVYRDGRWVERKPPR